MESDYSLRPGDADRVSAVSFIDGNDRTEYLLTPLAKSLSSIFQKEELGKKYVFEQHFFGVCLFKKLVDLRVLCPSSPLPFQTLIPTMHKVSHLYNQYPEHSLQELSQTNLADVSSTQSWKLDIGLLASVNFWTRTNFAQTTESVNYESNL
uniref:Uncharacterized protein n=1 Tax=Panagrellus redivivus TaxID=6233 RepID=A0A7E4UU88_PANRE